MIAVRSRHLGVALGTVAGKLAPGPKAGDWHQLALQALIVDRVTAVPVSRVPVTLFKYRGELCINGDTVALQELLRVRGWEDE